MKLFHIDKIRKNTNVIYKASFLGIKFSINVNEQVGIFDMIFAPVKFLFFKYKYNKFVNRKDKKIKKRLFLTNGNLNLLNTLAVIYQFKLNENSINDFATWSDTSNPEFEKITDEIMHLTDVNNHYCFYHIGRNKDFSNFFIKNMLCEYDEIYSVNTVEYIEVLKKLFPKAKYYLTEEGIFGVIISNLLRGIESFIFSNYLNKFDFLCVNTEMKDGKLNLSINNNVNLKIIDKEEFLKLSRKCEQMYPINIELNPEDKNIIYCGTYVGVQSSSSISVENVMNIQDNLIEALIKKGYTVIFKPHPRDDKTYKESKMFKILKTRIPLECYSLGDKCLAVVSLASSASSQMYHFQEVAGFCDYNYILNKKSNKTSEPLTLGSKIITSYIPSTELLLSIDTEGKDFKTLKSEINKKYLDFIKNQPKLSENTELVNEKYCKSYVYP